MKALALVCLIVAVVACGDSTGPNVRAASVTGFAGDSQLAPTSGAFQYPLSFVTLGSDGQPIQNVHVLWTVTPVGAATFSPQTSISDANGQVTTAVTAGPTAQEISIHASVPGVSSPVVFSALLLAPCAYARGVNVDETVNGVLSSVDCNYQGQGFFYDFYALGLPTGQQSIRITMQSTAFDTWIDLFRADGPYVGFDDDVVLTQIQNSQLDIILPGDVYLIGANSYNQGALGAYQLKVVNRPAAMNGCREVWVASGVSVADSLTAADCADTSLTASRFDVARIILMAGTTVAIAERSAAIDPKVALYRVTGTSGTGYTRELIASNDDSAAGNTNAFLADSITVSAPYDIVFGASTAGQTGAYTFDVTAVPPASAPAPGARAQSARALPGWLKRSKH